MKKFLLTTMLIIATSTFAQLSDYYSESYRFKGGDSINKLNCQVFNENKNILETIELKKDTISILGVIKCKDGSRALKFYKDNKIYYDRSFSGFIQNRVNKSETGTLRTSIDNLLLIPPSEEKNIISLHNKRDSLNLVSSKNKEIKNLESAERYKNFPCESISYSKDKFTSEKMWETQYNEFITIEKHIKNAETTYYFSLFYYDNFLTIPPKNTALILLFSDGTKLTKYDDVNVDYIDSDKGYQYHFFTSLNSNDLKILGSKKITDYKLYIFSSEFDQVASERLMKQTKCLVSKK